MHNESIVSKKCLFELAQSRCQKTCNVSLLIAGGFFALPILHDCSERTNNAVIQWNIFEVFHLRKLIVICNLKAKEISALADTTKSHIFKKCRQYKDKPQI